MLYWFFFILFSFLFCLLSLSHSLDKVGRNFTKGALVFVLIYFAAFRDHLGEDYNGYILKLSEDSDFTAVEPFFSLLSYTIKNTAFSYVFFFLVMSAITNFLYIKSIYRYDYVFFLLAIYLLDFSLYFQSFNIVRQMCAAALFFYSAKYIEEKRFRNYFLCILFAFTIHASSIILLPIYFVANKKISKFLLLLILFLSFYFSQNAFQLFSSINEVFSFYNYYFSSHIKGSGLGVIAYAYNLLLIVLILFKDRILINDRNIIAFNMYYISIVILNISQVNEILYRLSIFFFIFAPVAFSLLAMLVKSKRVLLSVVFLWFALVFTLSLIDYSRSNNRGVIPVRIRAFTELFK